MTYFLSSKEIIEKISNSNLLSQEEKQLMLKLVSMSNFDFEIDYETHSIIITTPFYFDSSNNLMKA